MTRTVSPCGRGKQMFVDRARADCSGEISAIAAADMVYDFLSILALGVKESPQLQAIRDEL